MVKGGMRHRVNVLNGGDSFGRVQLLNDRRAASILTVTECQLLRIDKYEFKEITNIKDVKHHAAKISLLKNIPNFSNAAPALLDTIASQFQTMVYEPNETVVQEGMAIPDLHWIVKGTCRIIKVVPFVERRIKVNSSTVNKQVLPYTPSTTIGPDEELIHHTFTIQELEPGDHFPGIPPLQDDPYANEFTFKKEHYVHQLELMDPTSQENKVSYSVVANSHLETMVISRLDFAHLSSKEIIVGALQSKNLHLISMTELQEAYLDKRKWQNFKKSVVKQVAGDVK
eukprot:jgi/Hompol1/299/HPOL_000896-RA